MNTAGGGGGGGGGRGGGRGHESTKVPGWPEDGKWDGGRGGRGAVVRGEV